MAKVTIKHKPSIIHFHEMQHGAYIFNLIADYRKIPNNSRNIVSTWGSDLTLYSWVDKHQSQIKSCFNWIDILTAEKEIELEDAERLGYKGEFRAPIYITVGQNFSDNLEKVKPSARKLIIIKGHQHDAGRALNILFVLSQMKDQLKNFEVIVYSAPESVQIQVDTLRNKHKMQIRTISRVSEDEMLSLFKLSRISLSLATSDGLPGALVEAMWAGAFPIQSGNSAAHEFITHGENGFIVSPWDLTSIQELLLRAISENDLVDFACEMNTKVLNEKYNLITGKSKLRNLYL